MKREQAMQTVFKHYLQSDKYHGPSAVFELKRTTNNALPFSSVKEHQEEALDAAINRSLYYKIPDDTQGQKVFDCFFLSNILAYVVVSYGQKLRSFIFIPINEWKRERETSKSKSLTYERALQIGHEVVI